MPLSFRSKSHGAIAFGFFQIEVDLLLLQEQFFFADEFCRAVGALDAGEGSVSMHGYLIAEAEKIGNVNGAINGWDRSGLIGASYERFPFPTEQSDFKQKTDGARHRVWARKLLDEFGTPAEIVVRQSSDASLVTIGKTVFSRQVYGELIDYVVRGGYPRWQDETPPSYVSAMLDKRKR